MISFWFYIWWRSQKIIHKMSQSPNAGSVTQTLRAKDSRAIKLGVLPRTLWSNDQGPALLVLGPSLNRCLLSLRTSSAGRVAGLVKPKNITYGISRAQKECKNVKNLSRWLFFMGASRTARWGLKIGFLVSWGSEESPYDSYLLLEVLVSSTRKQFFRSSKKRDL